MRRCRCAILAALLLSAGGLPMTAEAAGLESLQQFSDAVAEVAARVNPAVVAVQTETQVPVGDPFTGTPFEEFFRGHPFLQQPEGPDNRLHQGLGSGVIVSPDGYILTNNHVISVSRRRGEEVADRIQIELADLRTFEAKVVGRDPLSDLAVLKIQDGGDLPYLPFGDSDGLRVGEWVVAVGNPFGQFHTVTTGIVSALGRGGLFRGGGDNQPYEGFIQTDAAINPGNSGGALANIRGELVGINTMIVSRSGGYQGIGFAIPVNLARTVMDQLVEHGEVRRGLLGVKIGPIDADMAAALKLPSRKGALVSEVIEDTPAAAAGLKTYDVILAVGGQPTDTPDELRTRIAHTPPGTRVRLDVWRDGKEQTIGATLTALKDADLAAAGGEESEETGKLGMTVQALTDEIAGQLGYEDEKGVVVSQVQPGSAAWRAGLQRGDLIAEIDRRPVHTVSEYEKALANAKGPVLLKVRRATRWGVATEILTLRLPE